MLFSLDFNENAFEETACKHLESSYSLSSDNKNVDDAS